MEAYNLPDTEFNELGEEQIKSLYGVEHFLGWEQSPS